MYQFNIPTFIFLITESCPTERLDIEERTMDNQTNETFMRAIVDNKLNIARRMLREGANVNATYNGNILLHYAIFKCNLRLVKFLLDHGADVSFFDSGDATPLDYACCIVRKRSYDVCKLLLENGADCNFRNNSGISPFFRAAQIHPSKILKLLFDHGADIAAKDNEGLGALHFAVLNPHMDVLDFLLDQGLDINSSNEHGYTALHFAVTGNNVKVCEILLRRGAVVNGGPNIGLTPLSIAARPRTDYSGHEIRVVEILLEYGADVTGDILMAAASEGGNDDIREALMRHVVKLECLNSRINADHQQVIENNNCYKGYYHACLEELKNMKAAKFYKNVSMFNILTDDERLLSQHAKNEELKRALKKVNQKNKFPIYFALMKNRFCAALEKCRLHNNAAQIISDIFAFNHPSHPVNQNILRYLTAKDLKFLCSDVRQMRSMNDRKSILKCNS